MPVYSETAPYRQSVALGEKRLPLCADWRNDQRMADQAGQASTNGLVATFSKQQPGAAKRRQYSEALKRQMVAKTQVPGSDRGAASRCEQQPTVRGSRRRPLPRRRRWKAAQMLSVASSTSPAGVEGLGVSHNSPLEGDGFERSVPVAEEDVLISRRVRFRGDRRGSQKNLAGYRWFESISLQQTVRLSAASAFVGREPGFPRGCARPAWRPGRQRRAGCFDIALTGGNISVRPYSSTAVLLMWSATTHTGPNKVGPATGSRCGRPLNSGSSSSKAEHGSLLVPGKRQT